MNERLKEVRNIIGISQKEFAERLTLTRNMVSLMECGKRKISERTINDICKEYGVNKEWLVNGTGEMFKDCLKNTEIDEEIKEITERLFSLDRKERDVILNMIELLIEKNAL